MEDQLARLNTLIKEVFMAIQERIKEEIPFEIMNIIVLPDLEAKVEDFAGTIIVCESMLVDEPKTNLLLLTKLASGIFRQWIGHSVGILWWSEYFINTSLA